MSLSKYEALDLLAYTHTAVHMRKGWIIYRVPGFFILWVGSESADPNIVKMDCHMGQVLGIALDRLLRTKIEHENHQQKEQYAGKT